MANIQKTRHHPTQKKNEKNDRKFIENKESIFANEKEFEKHQKWEPFNEASLWLPGEGTTFLNGNYRYIVGEPINIGINGHIYYCYRWEKNNNNNNNNKSKEEKENTKIIKPIIETLGVKIVPNREDYSREFRIITKLQNKNSRNIIKLLDIISSEKIIFGIMELAKMDAHQFFVRNGLKRFNLTEKTCKNQWKKNSYINLRKPAIREGFAKQIMSDIVQALYDIKKNKYIHFDIKIRNILIFFSDNIKSFKNSGWKIESKLCDFGHSYYGEYRQSTISNNGNVNLGTHGHIAPELFIKNKKCNYKVDIWSLGITLLMILCPGHYIFDKYTTLKQLNEKYYNINNENINLRFKEIPVWWNEFQTLSPEARDLILYLTRHNPNDRPNYTQILNHPWFKMETNPLKYNPNLIYYNEYCNNSIYSMVAQE